MHPTLSEQVAKAIQRDRLAQAANARLVREAGGRRRASVLELSAFTGFLFEQIERLWQKRAERREPLAMRDAGHRSETTGHL